VSPFGRPFITPPAQRAEGPGGWGRAGEWATSSLWTTDGPRWTAVGSSTPPSDPTTPDWGRLWMDRKTGQVDDQGSSLIIHNPHPLPLLLSSLNTREGERSGRP